MSMKVRFVFVRYKLLLFAACAVAAAASAVSASQAASGLQTIPFSEASESQMHDLATVLAAHASAAQLMFWLVAHLLQAALPASTLLPD